MRGELQERGSAAWFRHLPVSHPVVTFYVLAFAVSWLGFVPLLLRSWGYSLFASPVWDGALVLPAAGPGLAAAIVSWNVGPGADRAGSSLLCLRRAFLRPVPSGWWVTTVLFSIGVMFVAALWTRYFLPGHASVLRPASAPALLLFAGMSLVANPIEEIGWRGFAQTRLEAHRPALRAAGIVGLLWAAWHLPLFLLSSGPMSMARIPFWPWAAGMVPQAVLLAWLYHKTGQSLATISLFHFLGNLAGMVFDSSVLVVSAMRIVAALAVVMVSGANLGRRNRSAPGQSQHGLAER